MLAEIKDEDDEVKFFDSELLNELRDLLQSSFGKYLYGDEVIKLEFRPNGYLGFDNQFILPIVATTVSPSLGRGYPSNIRNIVFGTMYIKSDGNIWFSAKESHGHITDSMGEMSTSSLIYREFMNINNRSKQLARDEVFTENIIKAIGAKSVRKIFTSNRYFPPYSGDGDGIYGDGITFAAEQDYYWGDENQKEIFLDLIQKIIDSTENTSRVNAATKKRLQELVNKSREEKFGNPNTLRPKDLIQGYNSRDEIFWAEYGRDFDARNRGGSVSIAFAVDVKPTSDDSYYFGGDSSRSKRSSEIANSDAPAPTKKQIQAIGELRNVVSDGRKDYRLFSDEEKSIPKQIFDGKIKIGEEEYSSAIDTSNLFVSQLTNGSVEKTFKFSGKVLDKDGNEVASFSRGINFLDGKPVSVTHDGLYIKRVGQGLGVATALNARNEKLYKELGIPKVVVNASTSGDGKVRGITHWLRNGYSWDDSTSRNKVLKIIDKALQDSIIKDKEQESAVREIRESIRKNLSNLNDDINLESLANWDGADEWFSSMAKEEENQILNVKLSKNLDSSETSSRSERNSSIPNGPDGLSQDLKIQIDLVKQAMENVKAMGVTTTSYSHEDLNKNVIKKLNAEILVIDKKIERVERKFGDSEATLRGNEAVRLARLAIDTMARTPDEYQMRQGTDELLISRDSEGNLVGLAMTWTTVDEFSRQEYMENEESSETRELRSRALSVEYLVSFQTVKGMGRALFGEVLKKAAGKGILFTQLEPTMYSKEYWERVGFKDDTTSLKQDKLVLVTALDNLESLLP